eukprot:927126-Prymnesium_polylepis.6
MGVRALHGSREASPTSKLCAILPTLDELLTLLVGELHERIIMPSQLLQLCFAQDSHPLELGREPRVDLLGFFQTNLIAISGLNGRWDGTIAISSCLEHVVDASITRLLAKRWWQYAAAWR